MMEDKTYDFIRFPRTFDNYKWYKPILVFIIALISFFVFQLIVVICFSRIYGFDLINTLMGSGYEAMNTEIGQIISDLSIIVIIPSVYIASKIVKDRPFSSYLSSHGGFNFKLYLKALIIPFIMYVIYESISVFINGINGINHFSILFLIVIIIIVPLQCIAEEIAFRGLIMQTLGSWIKIPVVVLIIQAIIFASLHAYNSLGIILIFVSGIIYGFFTWKTNGIEVSSALHTVNNFIIAVTVMLGLEQTSSTIGLFDLVISIVFEVILFALVYYVGEKTGWFGEIE